MSKEINKEYRMEDNSKCYFSTEKFARVLREIRRDSDEFKKKSKQEFFEDLADKTGISVSSINHWVMGHNAPSDPEKIRSIAEALQIDIFDILEMDKSGKGEERTMTYKNEREANLMLNNMKCDYSEPKDVIRKIYFEMVEFIENFRTTLAFEYDRFGEPFDIMYPSEQYSKIICMIRKSMLDIPYDTYKQLLQFAEGFLEGMIGDEFDSVDIWDITTQSDYESENPYKGQFVGFQNYCDDNGGLLETDQLEYVLMIADRAYKILEEILESYCMKK